MFGRRRRHGVGPHIGLPVGVGRSLFWRRRAGPPVPWSERSPLEKALTIAIFVAVLAVFAFVVSNLLSSGSTLSPTMPDGPTLPLPGAPR